MASGSNSSVKVKLHILCNSRAGVEKSKLPEKSKLHVTVLEENELIGSTETLEYPMMEFAKSVVVDYHPEKKQSLYFQLMADDGRHEKRVGSVMKTLGSFIVQGHWGKHEENGLTIRASEVYNTNDFVKIHLRAEKLDKGGFFRKRDAYLEFNLRYVGPVSLKYAVVHRTEVVESDLNPEWSIEVPVHELCNNDYERELLVNCYDRKKDDHELIGSFTTSLTALLSDGKKKFSYTDVKLNYDLMAPQQDKQGHSSGTSKKSGTIHVEECLLIYKRSFYDLIAGGLNVEFMVAIDFTGSNNNKNGGFHYDTPEEPSVYHHVLKEMRAVFEEYDTSKSYPAFGFGAKLPPDFDVCHHDFPLNFNWDNPRCENFDEVIKAYLNVSNTVEYSGPTHYAPMIRKCCEMAGGIEHGSKYYILLIITDGEAMDLPETAAAVAAASVLPISIIIVGMGEWRLQELEGEDCRKIVQCMNPRSINEKNLVKNVVPLIQEQVLEYMEINGFDPPAPPPAYSEF